VATRCQVTSRNVGSESVLCAGTTSRLEGQHHVVCPRLTGFWEEGEERKYKGNRKAIYYRVKLKGNYILVSK
jgi:hypothetical protein